MDLFTIVKALHNLVRWVVIILALAAAVNAAVGWFQKREWAESDRKIGSFTAMAMDIQILLGLLIYIFLSPTTTTNFSNFMKVMGIGDIRWYLIEHPFYMLLALVFAHLGSVLPKKAKDSAGRFKRAAIFFTLTALLLLLGTPWNRPLFPVF